MLKSRKKTSTN